MDGDGPSDRVKTPSGEDSPEPTKRSDADAATAPGKFVQLLASHQHRLRAYLLATVGSDQTADDLLQDTNLVLWNKREEFDHSRPFFPWACGIAYVEVMRSRRRVSTDRLCFDAALLENISSEFVKQADLLDDREEALRKCLDRLNPDERQLIQARYSDDWSVEDLAAKTRRPSKTIYGALRRIRESLYQCIERTISLSHRHRLN